MKVAAEMQLPKFVGRTHGLRMSEMRIKVLEPLEQVDKFFMLGLIDEMVEELSPFWFSSMEVKAGSHFRPSWSVT